MYCILTDIASDGVLRIDDGVVASDNPPGHMHESQVLAVAGHAPESLLTLW